MPASRAAEYQAAGRNRQLAEHRAQTAQGRRDRRSAEKALDEWRRNEDDAWIAGTLTVAPEVQRLETEISQHQAELERLTARQRVAAEGTAR